MIVVDASVAVKWLVKEIGSELADDLLQRHRGDFVAPTIFAVEVASALVRKANEVKANRRASEEGLESLAEMLGTGIVAIQPTAIARLIDAAKLALDLGHPLKDCLYLALAIELECELVTCDTRFATKARGVCDRVRVLGA